MFSIPESPDTRHIILIMVLGKLAHYAFDAILLSTVAAGVKHTTGFMCVPDPIFRLADMSAYLVLALIQSQSLTQLFDLSLNGTSALAKPCSTQ